MKKIVYNAQSRTLNFCLKFLTKFCALYSNKYGSFQLNFESKKWPIRTASRARQRWPK